MLVAPPPPAARAARPALPGPRRGSTTGWVAVGFGAAGAALLAARAAGHTPGPCLLLSHTGVACPACGLTRLAVTLAQGQLGPALVRDLPGTLLLIVLALVAVAQLGSLGGRRVPGLGGRALPLALGALLAAHWAIAMATSGFTT